MIALFCYYFDPIGFARHGRGFVDALNRLEEVALLPWDTMPPGTILTPEQEEMLARGRSYRGDGVAIGIGPIENLPSVRGAWRIGFAVWETTVIPPDKVAVLRSMDEIWTPSHWGRDILLRNGMNPDVVRVVPQAVDTQKFRPVPRRDAARPFRFLTVGKFEVRKGYDLLIPAFCNEFRSGEPVELVLHCFNTFWPGYEREVRAMSAALEPHPPITIGPRLPEEAIGDLYNSCDAFVLPTRAEGWGLPVMEAMASELPVIITDYSAPREYLDESVAYLVCVNRMSAVRDPVFYRTGNFGAWAEPDARELRRIMRHVYTHREEASEKGRRARERVMTCWTWQHAAGIAMSFLPRAVGKATHVDR